MKKIVTVCIITIIPVLLVLWIWWRAPLIGNKWSKQTLYICLLDAWYGSSTDQKAHALWIDDDSSEGVFTVRKIADEIGIQPVFAVIADKMTPTVVDSLVSWQKKGAGIILHGLRHERWKDWNKTRIEDDIRQSLRRLEEQGFDTTKLLKYILPPHSCNSKAIREAIKQQGCQLISGANLVNPDRHVFQLGRITITPKTDTLAMRKLLQKAYDRKAFVIFSTHSSIPSEFSTEKTRKILRMAKEIGFDFDIFE